MVRALKSPEFLHLHKKVRYQHSRENPKNNPPNWALEICFAARGEKGAVSSLDGTKSASLLSLKRLTMAGLATIHAFSDALCPGKK